MILSNCGHSCKYPLSIKGIVQVEGRYVLLKNERDECELPGGKLEPGESPETCLVREIQEETTLAVQIDGIVDCWVYEVFPEVYIPIVTYGCSCTSTGKVQPSSEHKEAGLFSDGEVERLRMPEGYKRSIRLWQHR